MAGQYICQTHLRLREFFWSNDLRPRHPLFEHTVFLSDNFQSFPFLFHHSSFKGKSRIRLLGQAFRTLFQVKFIWVRSSSRHIGNISYPIGLHTPGYRKASPWVGSQGRVILCLPIVQKFVSVCSVANIANNGNTQAHNKMRVQYFRWSKHKLKQEMINHKNLIKPHRRLLALKFLWLTREVMSGHY